jgi:hypothetical protein
VDALAGAEHLGSAVPDLTFTRDGLEPIVQSARTGYLLGTVFASCGKATEAKAKFELASTASAPDQIKWAWLAARKLPAFNQAQWQDRLQTCLVQAESRSDTSAYPSWWEYTAASLARELGRPSEADVRFRKALLLPDRMLAYHLTRLAKSEATQ